MTQASLFKEVEVSKLSSSKDEELTENACCCCSFCNKVVRINDNNKDILESLNPKNDFYCTFCLRHNLHHKNNRNVLIFSLRAILGHYYNILYAGKDSKISLTEIGDIIAWQEEVGLRNPVFLYDPETFLWFINFNYIGKEGRRIKIDSVLQTTQELLNCFRFKKYVLAVNESKVYEKFGKAVWKFYQTRQRPDDKRMLIPGLKECGTATYNSGFDYSAQRDFTKKDLILRNSC